MKTNKKRKQTSVIVLLSLVFILLILVPLVSLLSHIDSQAWHNIFHGGQFSKALVNTLVTALMATLISVFISYIFALAISRTNIKFKGLFATILILPMLIPSISCGLGLIILFGNNGIFTNLLGTTSHLYGYFGIIYGSVLYSFPVAFIMFLDILKYEDMTVYDAANVLGIPKSKQFLHISLPYLKKTLISIFFTVFTLIVTDYGIPIAVGGKVKTLSLLLYENAVGQLNYSSGALIGVFLLIPALIACLIDFFNKNNEKTSYVSKEFVAKKNKVSTTLGYFTAILGSILVVLVILPFILQAFTVSYPTNLHFTLVHFKETFAKMNLNLINSILMSLLTAFVGMALSFICAYYTARVKTKATKFLHFISILSLSIPGLVLGLSYIFVFKTTFLYGTLTLLILVNTVHFFASPYQILYNALLKVNSNLENVGEVLNIPTYRIVSDCIIPQCKSSLAESFSYFFVNSMMTISAVSFLATSDNQPLSLLINQFESYNMIECAAVVALIILFVNILMKSLIYCIKKEVKVC